MRLIAFAAPIAKAVGLSYQEGKHLDPNIFSSFNGWVTITDDGYSLSFEISPQFPSTTTGYRRYQTSVTQDRIVEGSWVRFMTSLG